MTDEKEKIEHVIVDIYLNEPWQSHKPTFDTLMTIKNMKQIYHSSLSKKMVVAVPMNQFVKIFKVKPEAGKEITLNKVLSRFIKKGIVKGTYYL